MIKSVVGLGLKMEMTIVGDRNPIGTVIGEITEVCSDENGPYGFRLKLNSPFYFEDDTMVGAILIPYKKDEKNMLIESMNALDILNEVYDGPFRGHFSYITPDGRSESPGDKGIVAEVTLA